MASSKDCPVFKKEKEIQKIKSEKNVSYGEARRLYNTTHNTNQSANKTYASALKSTASIGTQTSLTWPDSEYHAKDNCYL